MDESDRARLDALGNENRLVRQRCEEAKDENSRLRERVVRLEMMVSQVSAAHKDLKDVNKELDARLGVLEEAKARAVGMRIAFSMASGIGGAAGYNWMHDNGGIVEALASMWAM